MAEATFLLKQADKLFIKRIQSFPRARPSIKDREADKLQVDMEFQSQTSSSVHWLSSKRNIACIMRM